MTATDILNALQSHSGKWHESGLATRLGDDLLVGLVLYTGQDTLAFGPKNRAMPVSALWEVSS